MTQTSTLSTEQQAEIVSHTKLSAKLSREDARKPLLWTAGLLAATAALAVFAPVALGGGLALLLAAGPAMTMGAIAASHLVKERAMKDAEQSAGKPGFAEKLHQKAAKMTKALKFAEKATIGSFVAFLGVALGSAVFPPLAVAAMPLAAVMIGGAMTRTALSKAAPAIVRVDQHVDTLIEEEAAAAQPAGTTSLQNPQAGALKNTPPLAARFKNTVSNTAPASSLPQNTGQKPNTLAAKNSR